MHNFSSMPYDQFSAHIQCRLPLTSPHFIHRVATSLVINESLWLVCLFFGVLHLLVWVMDLMDCCPCRICGNQYCHFPQWHWKYYICMVGHSSGVDHIHLPFHCDRRRSKGHLKLDLWTTILTGNVSVWSSDSVNSTVSDCNLQSWTLLTLK